MLKDENYKALFQKRSSFKVSSQRSFSHTLPSCKDADLQKKKKELLEIGKRPRVYN